MAPQSKVTTMSNDASKKPKSLKDLKKAQKDKQAAKRASAAANFKVKKATIVADVPKEESMAVEVPQNSGAAQANEGISAQAVTDISSTADDALSSQTVELQAHRKALEAAHYENMETPMQMLMRVHFAVSVDTEYHQYGDGDELVEDGDKGTLKCLDDNRFVINRIVRDLYELATVDGTLLADGGVFVSLTADTIKSQQEDKPTIVSLSMDEVFSKVKSEGVLNVGSSGFKSSRTLESVELELTKTFTIGHLFTLASQTGNTILRAASMNNPSAARSVESIEREMSTARYNPEAAPFTSCIDPAIISCQVKKNPSTINEQQSVFKVEKSAPASDDAHSEASEKLKSLIGIALPDEPFSSTNSQPSSPQSSHHGTGYWTPLTRFSDSPPLAVSQDAPAFFGGYYPIWADALAEPPYTRAPPLIDFSSGGQPFYAWLADQPWPIYQPPTHRRQPSAWA